MRRYYSFVRFAEKTAMPSNALLKDVKSAPTVKLYRDVDTDPNTITVEWNGNVSDYPWAQVLFARREPEQPEEKAPATKKGKA